MPQFRDSRGRFSSRPRDSAGRWRSVEWYNRSQGQKRRRERETIERAAVSEWQRSIERREVRRAKSEARAAAPAVERQERQSYFELTDVAKSEVDSSTRLKVNLESPDGGTIFQYDGPAETFDPRAVKTAMDSWSEEIGLGKTCDSPNCWRAPGVRIFETTYYQAPAGGYPPRIDVRMNPDAVTLIQTYTGRKEDSEPEPPAVGRGLQAEEPPAAWPDEEDALPE